MSTDYVGAPSASGGFVLRDVTVVDVLNGTATGGQDVRIADGKIADVGPAGREPGEVPVTHGNGAFVFPATWTPMPTRLTTRGGWPGRTL